MKKWIGISCLTAIVSLMFMVGCDSDSGTEWDGTLLGNWEAVKEVLILESGKVTMTPTSSFFMNLIIEVHADSTYEYEMWTGPDKNAEEAEYKTGTGAWSSDGSTTFSLVFGDDEDAMVIEGTYKASDSKLIINATMVIDMFGTDPVPLEVTFNRPD